MRPQVKLLTESGEEVRIAGTEHAVSITFQVGSLITVKDGQQVSVVTCWHVSRRNPRRPATLPVVCRVWPSCSKPRTEGCRRAGRGDGTVSFGKDTKGKQRLVITEPDGTVHEFLIPKDKHVMVPRRSGQ